MYQIYIKGSNVYQARGYDADIANLVPEGTVCDPTFILRVPEVVIYIS